QVPPVDLDFSQEAGPDAGPSGKAVVHFGTCPNKFPTYHLEACIYSSSAPEKPINCADFIRYHNQHRIDERFPVCGSSDDTSASNSTGDSEDSATAESQ